MFLDLSRIINVRSGLSKVTSIILHENVLRKHIKTHQIHIKTHEVHIKHIFKKTKYPYNSDLLTTDFSSKLHIKHIKSEKTII